jgi:dTDP-4-dehydrorhamnose 3,5-epimerase
MRFMEAPIPGAWVVESTPFVDARGRFMRAWCAQEFAEHGIRFVPVQGNIGTSHRAGTIRGLHYQAAPHEEAKLVRCTRGRVLDVLVDLRPGSPTYGRWFGTELSSENGRMLYVPPLCGHGYQTLEDESEIFYLSSAAYAPDAVRGLRYNDPAIGIDWPLLPMAVSDQDLNWPFLTPHSPQADR